jgi:hypothetical protein
MNATKIALAIAVTSIMVVAAISPTILGQTFAKTTTCSQGPPDQPCSGNSDTNNKNRCETTKAGSGNGGGEIKGTTC